jgi:hypothetical protein
LQRILIFFLISQIVTGQNANKSKFKAPGQTQGKQGYQIRQSYLQISFKLFFYKRFHFFNIFAVFSLF